MYFSINVTHEEAIITAYKTLESSGIAGQQRFPQADMADFDEAMKIITNAIDKLRGQDAVEAVSISLAGQVDPRNGKVQSSYSYRGWDGHVLKRELGTLGCPIYVENDAVVAALGQYRQGQDTGKRLGSIYFARDVGIGATVVNPVDQQLVIYPVEFGHIVVVPDGRSCECGQKGCLEQYVAGRGIIPTQGFATETIRDEEILVMTARYLTQGIMTLLVFYPLDSLYLTGQRAEAQRPFLETMADYTSEMLKRKFIFTRPTITVSGATADSIELGNLAQLAYGDTVVNMRYAE